MSAKKIGCKIRRYSIRMDPSLSVFNVELHKPNGIWTESFGSEKLLRAFLRGVRAGADMSGGEFFSEPEIPSGSTSIRIPKSEGED